MKAPISCWSIFALSVPLILTGIGETIIDVTDAVFLARYGIVELGAVAVADAFYGIVVVGVLALVDGIQVLIARRAGEGRLHDVGRTFNQGVYLLVLGGVAVTLLTKLASPMVMAWVILSEEVAVASDAFLQIVAYKVVFDAMNFAYSALLVGIGRPRPLVGATVILVGTNIVLDYILIFGHFGMPRLGIEGAAIASLVAEVAGFAYLTGAILTGLDVRRFRLFAFGPWDGRLTRALVRISSPVAVDALVETTRWFLFFLIVERLGEEPLAVSNIIYSCYVVLLIAQDGFSETVCSLASRLIGQGNARRIWILLRRAMWLSCLVTVPLVALTLAGPTLVLSIFSPDAQFMDGAVASLRVIAVVVLIVIPATMLTTTVTGTGDTAGGVLIELLTSLTILGCAYAAARWLQLPLPFVWMSEGIGWLVGTAVSYLWLKSGIWRRLAI